MLKKLPANIGDKRILDVASGFGTWGYQLRIKEKNLPYLVGLELWVPYLEFLKTLNIYSSLVLADARNLPFRGGSFQITLACEIVEHLSYTDGMLMIDELERIMDGMIVISTPKGFMHQDEINGNPFEKHVSAWQEVDFEKRGFSTITIEVHPLTRALRLVDRIRRWIFNFEPALKEIIAIKGMCGGAWPRDAQRTRDNWYNALEKDEEINMAMRFTLSQEPVTTAIPPGFLDLFYKAILVGKSYSKITEPEIQKLREMAKSAPSVFQRMEQRADLGDSPNEPLYADSPHECCPYSNA